MRFASKICILFFLIGCSQSSFAQEEPLDTTIGDEVVESPQEQTETSDEAGKTHRYERHYMDEERLQSLRSKSAFKYPDLENDTLEVKQESTAPSVEFKGIDASVFLWLIVAIGAVIAILQLSGLNVRQLFAPAKAKSTTNPEQISENIHEIPFESAISEAIKAGNYSLATRLMYLQGLKLLSDKDLIAWHENKTNWQYVYELKNSGLRSSFRNITSIFEYVQYGNMKIESDKFILVQEAFRNFKMHVV